MKTQQITKKLTNLMIRFKQVFESSKVSKESNDKSYCVFVVPEGSTNPDKDRMHFMLRGDDLSDEEISRHISKSKPF